MSSDKQVKGDECKIWSKVAQQVHRCKLEQLGH